MLLNSLLKSLSFARELLHLLCQFVEHIFSLDELSVSFFEIVYCIFVLKSIGMSGVQILVEHVLILSEKCESLIISKSLPVRDLHVRNEIGVGLLNKNVMAEFSKSLSIFTELKEIMDIIKGLFLLSSNLRSLNTEDQK